MLLAANKILIISTHLCSAFSKKLLHRKHSIDLLLEYVSSTPNVYALYSDSEYCEMLKPVATLHEKSILSEQDLIRGLEEVIQLYKQEHTLAEGNEETGYTIELLYAGFPYLQKKTCDELYDLHIRTGSEYTFADGYPVGTTCEYIDSRILRKLDSLCKTEELSWNSLFSIVSRDINTFDIETLISKKDYRSLRVELTTDTEYGYSQCKSLAARGAETAVEDVLDIIDADRGALRTIPNYLRLELTNQYCYSPGYAPTFFREGAVEDDYKDKVVSSIKVNDFFNILAQIQLLNSDATIEIGCFGEPSHHKELGTLLDHFNSCSMQGILVSTGLGWSDALLSKVCNAKYRNITFVFVVEGYNQQTYSKHRNASFEEVYRVIKELQRAYPKKTYVETVRLLEHESDLLSWYTYWKDQGVTINIKKYNDFQQSSAYTKSVDLSPLNRHVCWQLEREMTIDCFGNVLQCSQDIEQSYKVGNCLNESLETLWLKQESLYKQHLAGTYEHICANCDEYYTFNG